MYHVELASEEGSTTVLCLALVRRMILEELALIIQSCTDGLVGINITLSTVHDWDITQAKGDHSASEDIHNVRSSVPGAEFR